MLTDREFDSIRAQRVLARTYRKTVNRNRYVRRMKRIYPNWGKHGGT